MSAQKHAHAGAKTHEDGADVKLDMVGADGVDVAVWDLIDCGADEHVVALNADETESAQDSKWREEDVRNGRLQWAHARRALLVAGGASRHMDGETRPRPRRIRD